MKLKLLAACGFAAACTAFPAAGANPAAGDNVVSVGMYYIHPIDDSSAWRTDILTNPLIEALGVPEGEFKSPGTELHVSDSRTLALDFTHFFTNHISVTFAAGWPPEFKLWGVGTIEPNGSPSFPYNVALDEPEFNPLVKSIKLWAPSLVAQYYFFPEARFRPFVGVGVIYARFADIQLDQEFRDYLVGKVGPLLTLANNMRGEEVDVQTNAPQDVEPIFTGGFLFRLYKNVDLHAAVSWTPLETEPELRLTADGTTLLRSTTDLELNAMIAAVTIAYNFGNFGWEH